MRPKEVGWLVPPPYRNPPPTKALHENALAEEMKRPRADTNAEDNRRVESLRSPASGQTCRCTNSGGNEHTDEPRPNCSVQAKTRSAVTLPRERCMESEQNSLRMRLALRIGGAPQCGAEHPFHLSKRDCLDRQWDTQNTAVCNLRCKWADGPYIYFGIHGSRPTPADGHCGEVHAFLHPADGLMANLTPVKATTGVVRTLPELRAVATRTEALGPPDGGPFRDEL